MIGNYVMQHTITGAGNGSYIYSAGNTITVTPGQQYTASVYLKPVTGLRNMRINIVWRGTTATVAEGATVTPTTLGEVIRLDVTGTATNDAQYMQPQLLVANPQINDEFRWDGVMVTAGSSLYSYADGNSPSWSWTGSQNSSTSTGPAL